MKTTYIFIILIFLTVFHSPFHVNAQDNCLQVLENAEKLFDEGIIEKIPELLEDCLKKGFDSDERIRARKLIILSHLFDNRPEEAEEVMSDLLRDAPEYQIQPGDPSEFSSLYSSFKTFPFLSIGILGGVNLATATMVEPYGPYDAEWNEGSFSFATPEYHAGVGVNVYLTDRWEISLEGIYTRTSFLWSNLQYDFAQIDKKEIYQKVEIPLSFTYDFPGQQWKPYLRLGASYGLVISASADYERTYTDTGLETFTPVEENGIDISNRRETSTINAVAGTGIKYRIPRGYLVLDLRYFYGLTDIVNPENRWEQETVFSFYDADGNFQVDYFTISIGLRYSFYKSKKL